MGGTWASIGLVVMFVLIGGVFAAAEIALVSLRDSQARGWPTGAAAARSWPSSTRTPTASWPPSRSA